MSFKLFGSHQIRQRLLLDLWIPKKLCNLEWIFLLLTNLISVISYLKGIWKLQHRKGVQICYYRQCNNYLSSRSYVRNYLSLSTITFRPILHINGIEYIWAKGLCKTTFEDSKNKTWNFLFLLATRGLAYIVAIVTTLIAYKRAFSLTQNLPEDVREAFNISSKRLLVYPTAQLIIYTPNVFYDFVSIFMPYKYLPLLIVTALWSLGGFVNFLIYGGMLIQHKRAYSVESRNFSHSNYQNFDATSDGEWGINTKLSYDNEEDMLTMVVRNRLESKIM